MIINNGRQEVDTAQATFLGKSESVVRGDSYSFETRWVYTAWKSTRTETWFIAAYYEERIAKIAKAAYRLFGIASRPACGHSLLGVYSEESEFRTACAARGITSIGGSPTMESL